MIKTAIFSYFLLLANTVFAQSTTEYCNDRYQFCVVRPADFIALPLPENGDGAGFKSTDQAAEFVAFGCLVVQEINDSLETVYTAAQKDVTVTYKIRKKDWFVVSGIDTDGKIFYQKTARKTIDYNGSETEVYWTAEIKYPASQKEKYDPYCALIAKFWK